MPKDPNRSQAGVAETAARRTSGPAEAGRRSPGRAYEAAPQATAAHARARTARLLEHLRHSWLFKLTVLLGVAWVISALPLVLGHAPWVGFGLLRGLFSAAVFVLLVRVVYLLAYETLWLLRNRLILAYVFMGVVPVVLIGAMLAIAAYMFYGQYASYLLLNSLSQRTRNLQAVNSLTVRELDRRPQQANEITGLARYYASYYFPRHNGGVRSYFYDAKGQPLSEASRQLGAPAGWLKSGFYGVVARPQGYFLASFGAAAQDGNEEVLSLYPLSVSSLDAIANGLGHISLIALPNGTAASALPAFATPGLASHQAVPARASLFDLEITSWAFVPVTDWSTGQQGTIIATINTRPSQLNAQLFASLPSPTNDAPLANRWPLFLLAAIGVGFLIIEAFSLVAGIRLTRTITGAVNDLYIGTEHVNRGDFGYRIPVHTRDQLAALEISFNTMTSSILRLLEEQRQKHRLESELTIAHEVQTQLFPRVPPQVAGLEILGRCLPARVVSGDYFDFLQLNENRVSIALGDISGKGISAALLMATIVAAVRAYQPSLAEPALAVGAGAGHAPAVLDADAVGPALLLERLNRQLYHSTTPEKYATLFYASYDSVRHELRYTNAGHLPPVVIGAHGRRRLDRGGMVLGLFEDVRLEDGVVQLEAGDLLAAWSDGITEPENEYGVEFGEEHLLELLEHNRTRPLSDIMQTVLAAVKEWSVSEEQADDITLVLARVTG